jgi:hypothetical protein
MPSGVARGQALAAAATRRKQRSKLLERKSVRMGAGTLDYFVDP